MLTTYVYIALIVIMSSAGAILIKEGSWNITFKNIKAFIKSFFNTKLMVGALLYFLQVQLFIRLLKDIELSVLFPVVSSLNYLLVSVVSFVVLKEKINNYKTAGTLLIIIGIILISAW